MEPKASDYKIAGLAFQKSAITDQLGRTRRTASLARIILLGKLKAIQRELNALPSEPFEFKGVSYQRDAFGKVVRVPEALK